MEEAKLTLELRPEGHYVVLDTFIEALEDLRRMLRSISVSSATKPMDWLVTGLQIGSAIAAVEPTGDPAEGLAVSQMAILGLEALERDGTPPHSFPPDAIEAAGHLAELMARTKTRASISGLSRHLELTARTAKAAERLLDVAVWEDLGSVEGSLEMVSVHSGYTCNVYERHTGRRVPCYFRREHIDKVTGLLGRQTVVFGLVRYNRRGDTLSVTMDDIAPVPGDDDLPSIRDMIGLAPDITGGLTTEEFIRRLRDDS